MWLPHVTVATVIARPETRGDTFLMVEEIDNGLNVYNQPAGHVEDTEDIIDAAIREAYEETCWHVRVASSLGITRFIAPNGDTYFRHSFIAEAIEFDERAIRDQDIINTHWFTADEIRSNASKLRSPMVLNDINRYLKGESYSLDLYATL